jgi:hypothetical protein
MVITLKLTGSTDVVLVHGEGNPSDAYAQGPLGDQLAFESQQSVSLMPLIQATFPLVILGKNINSQLKFGAIRCFTSRGAAQRWASMHVQALAGFDTLVITNDETSNPATTTLTGGIEACVPSVLGVSVTIEYSFKFGKVV